MAQCLFSENSSFGWFNSMIISECTDPKDGKDCKIIAGMYWKFAFPSRFSYDIGLLLRNKRVNLGSQERILLLKMFLPETK